MSPRWGSTPPARVIPGQAVAVRPKGDSAEEMIVEDGVYLKVVMRNNSSAKRNLRDGFKKADDHLKKVEKEREKFDKAQAKAKGDKKKSSSKSKSKETFVPPPADPRVQPFFDLREGKLRALVSIRNAASYEHLIDAIGDEEFEWHLRVPLTRDIDVFHVADKVGERGCFVLMEPLITLVPGTLRQRNLPAEFERAGAKLVLLPRTDSKAGFESFLEDVGVMIGAGLDRKAAVRAITPQPQPPSWGWATGSGASPRASAPTSSSSPATPSSRTPSSTPSCSTASSSAETWTSDAPPTQPAAPHLAAHVAPHGGLPVSRAHRAGERLDRR